MGSQTWMWREKLDVARAWCGRWWVGAKIRETLIPLKGQKVGEEERSVENMFMIMYKMVK